MWTLQEEGCHAAEICCITRGSWGGEVYRDSWCRCERWKKNGFAPLRIAAHNGHLDVTKYLVTAGTDVNAAHKNDFTLLKIGTERTSTWGGRVSRDRWCERCRQGRLHAVAFCWRERGTWGGEVSRDSWCSDPSVNVSGRTALVFASVNSHAEIVKLLGSKLHFWEGLNRHMSGTTLKFPHTSFCCILYKS